MAEVLHLSGSKLPTSPPTIPQDCPKFKEDHHRPVLMVIDDEGLVADSLAEILCDHGYDAKAFYSGVSAVEHAKLACPDIVMTDMVMPKMNGVEAAIAIKKACPAAHILLFSGQASTSDLLRPFRDSGISFELLAKPIHPVELLKRLARLTST